MTGAGGGLGREVARQLAGRGVFVAVTDINARGAQETADLCGGAAGPAVALAGDLTARGAGQGELARSDIVECGAAGLNEVPRERAAVRRE